jgi:Ca2+-binding RTX toxin-like protein
VRTVRSWMVTSVAAAAVLCAATPSALASATLTKPGGIVYAAAPGDVDAVSVRTDHTTTGWIASITALPARGGATIESPDRSCIGASLGVGFTGCFAAPGQDAAFNLGDRDDYVELGVRTMAVPPISGFSPKAVIHGGAGTDTVRYLEPVRASLDGVANDGPAGFTNDNIGTDVEVLEGSDLGDHLEGGPGANTLLGDGGDDEIHAIDHAADVIDCGAGDDLAVVDAIDTTRNCETVAESGRVAPAPGAPAAPAETAPASAQRVVSGVDDKWIVTKRYTKVTRLVVEDVPSGGAVTVDGAPVRVTGGKASLTKRFKGRRLKPGKVIQIRATAPGMTQRTIRFTIRAKKLPLKATS